MLRRPRRLRINSATRNLVRETKLNIEDLIYPLFIVEGENIKREISSLPDVYHFSLDMLEEEIKEIKDLGIEHVILFGIPHDHEKDACGSEAYNENGIIQRAVRKIKEIDNKEEVIPILVVNPLYTYEDLSKINTILGRFETHFNSKNYNRVNNIRLAAKATNNILLDTGEVFSFNSNIQNSHIDKYLKEAPVIINGKPNKGIGGGMCQVSSTIYNAALYSGLKIINVRNHSIPSPYIEKGRDATVSVGCIDLKFLNKYNTPIFIYNEVMDNKIVCTIYGNEKDIKDIEVITETTDILHNRIIRKNSEKYNLGVRKIEQEGRQGYKVKTYRVYKNNFGKKTEYIGESYYPPQDKIIIYGTRELRK